MEKIKVGVIGCGVISDIYMMNCKETFSILDLVACADIVPEKAKEKAEKYGIKACSVEELLADPEIKIVLNLTIPKAHAEVTLSILNAGKHVYVEKPLAVTLEEGKKVMETARAKGLLVSCAPDTFLGAGIQTSRKLIDDGWIGTPIAATAFFTCRGHESWHPDPEFYYQVGGGPMFDMGPYYLTALVALLGPVKRVTGSARKTFEQRTITSAPKYGTKIDVEVPTHVAGVMDFESGAVGTIITSFDVWHADLPRIEIYGTEGTLSVPDPNGFGGPVRIKRAGETEWTTMPLTHGFGGFHRGLGVADMAHALKSGRSHRANGDMAYHVLEIMHAFHDASLAGKHIELESTCEAPAPFPMGLTKDKLD